MGCSPVVLLAAVALGRLGDKLDHHRPDILGVVEFGSGQFLQPFRVFLHVKLTTRLALWVLLLPFQPAVMFDFFHAFLEQVC